MLLHEELDRLFTREVVERQYPFHKLTLPVTLLTKFKTKITKITGGNSPIQNYSLLPAFCQGNQ